MSKLAAYRDPGRCRIPKSMFAAVLSGTGFESLSVREMPMPQVGANQLLCRVDAAGVCTSILKLIDQGSNHAFLNGWDLKRYPIILGDEGSLTVVKVGPNLKDQYHPGQRFGIQPAVDIPPINHRERYKDEAHGMSKCAVGYTLGGNLAQYLLIQEEVLAARCLLPLPDQSLPYFGVSMAEPISCVYSAQERQVHLIKNSPFSRREPVLGMLQGGHTLIIGAGPMGLMHAELAIRFRPRNLIICDKIQPRLQLAEKTLGEKARRAGVQLIVTSSEHLRETIQNVTGGAGVDDLILAVGIQPVQQEALELLGKGGVANLFGGLPRGQHTLQVDALRIHYDEIRLVGSSGGQPSDLAATLQAIAKHEIDPGNYIYGIGTLRHAPEVLRMIKEGKVEGKVILYPHADIAELVRVDHWDKHKEEALLEQNLISSALVAP